MDYLTNYLSVLPTYDREEVSNLINSNMEIYETRTVSQDEFEALLQQLAVTREKITELEPTGDKLDAEHFNRMHSSVALDLTRLYNSNLAIEKVVSNYDRILRGLLDDIRKEINSLSLRVEELDLQASGEAGLIVRTYNFDDQNRTDNAETNVSQFPHLFVDRNGSPLPLASMNRVFNHHYLALPHKIMEDALQGDNGFTTADIEFTHIKETAIHDINHPLRHSIDGSSETYWTCVVEADGPMRTEILKGGA